MAGTTDAELRIALHAFDETLVLLEVDGASKDAALIERWAHGFVLWLGRPLWLRCLHRRAAAHELLREDAAATVEAHQALIDAGYCNDVLSELMELSADPTTSGSIRRQYSACLAPIARGVVLFSEPPSPSAAAFARVRRLTNPAGEPALSWTTRWQLPDHHREGLSARPFWPESELPAATKIAGHRAILEAEFQAVLAAAGGVSAFTVRHADAWIPDPHRGWGMVDLAPYCADLAKETCILVRSLRQSKESLGGDLATQPSDAQRGRNDSVTGAGYYMLRPGTWLR
eukprot:SAG31_NODE_9746_length_1234_cov_0.978855_1_plen_287_part_00